MASYKVYKSRFWQHHSVIDSFTLFRNQNCFRRNPTPQTWILPYVILAHWKTQVESPLDYLLTIGGISPVSEKNGFPLKVRFYLRSLRMCFPCKEHLRIRGIIQVAQILSIGFRWWYLKPVAIRFNSLLPIQCGNTAYNLISYRSYHVLYKKKSFSSPAAS